MYNICNMHKIYNIYRYTLYIYENIRLHTNKMHHKTTDMMNEF